MVWWWRVRTLKHSLTHCQHRAQTKHQRYLETAFTHPAVCRGKAAAIGYCAGGQAVLEQVRHGDQLQAAVTFHGLLQSRPMHVDRIYTRPPEEVCYTDEEIQELVDVVRVA